MFSLFGLLLLGLCFDDASISSQHDCTWIVCVHGCRQEGSRSSFEEADGSVVQVTCHTGHPRNALESLDHAMWSFKRAVGHVLQHLASPGEFF
jgi:hypothetical protein